MFALPFIYIIIPFLCNQYFSFRIIVRYFLYFWFLNLVFLLSHPKTHFKDIRVIFMTIVFTLQSASDSNNYFLTKISPITKFLFKVSKTCYNLQNSSWKRKNTYTYNHFAIIWNNLKLKTNQIVISFQHLIVYQNKSLTQNLIRINSRHPWLELKILRKMINKREWIQSSIKNIYQYNLWIKKKINYESK